MTEGIIQKVQRRILEKYYDSSEKGELTDIFVTELIAEIKKEIQSDDDITIRLVVKRLIGDNQE